LISCGSGAKCHAASGRPAALESDTTPDHRRETIGLRLNQRGDPRRGVGVNDDGLPDIAWVDVPAGEVTIEKNAGHFTIAAFCIARHPVTWRLSRAFVKATDDYRSKRWWHGLRMKPSRASRAGPWPITR